VQTQTHLLTYLLTARTHFQHHGHHQYTTTTTTITTRHMESLLLVRLRGLENLGLRTLTLQNWTRLPTQNQTITPTLGLTVWHTYGVLKEDRNSNFF